MDDIRYISRLDREYPEKLKFIKDAPAGIYVKGKLPDEDKKSVAIVGSRQCSMYGRKMAEYFGAHLAAAGIQIISGMAVGVDGISQEAALSVNGSTFAVLGSGVDVVYPKSNIRIYEEITEKGGIISEQPPGSPPKGAFFAERNRIISALCDVLLVIEARIKSGTGITVRYALDQGKDIFALPGRINDPMSAGTNKLISEGAGVALNPDVIIRELLKSDGGAKVIGKKNGVGRKTEIVELEGNEKLIYSLMDLYPKKTDELMAQSMLSLPAVLDAVLRLRLKGLVEECGKNNYVRTQL